LVQASIVTTGQSAPRRIGDRLELKGLEPGVAGTLTLTNLFNGLSKTTPIDAATGSLLLDATTLPGFRADAKVQEFTVEIKTATFSSRPPSLFVVADADVQAFPQVGFQLAGPMPPSNPDHPVPIATPGPGAWTALDSTTGPDAYIQSLVSRWGLQSPTITHTAVDRAEVQLPSYLKTAPDTTKFVRYEVKSQFPKYLVPKEYSSSGQADVYAPTSLSILLTQTDPADLVSLMAK
jgi:hypothetical protein